MSREVSWREVYGRRSAERAAAAQGAGELVTPEVPRVPDSYAARIVKLIPVEVISLYVTLDALIRGTQQAPAGLLHWVAFIAGVAGTPYYLYVLQKVRKISQILVSMVAFVIWVLALGGPFEGIVSPLIGAVLLVLFTFAVPAAQN